MTTNSTLCAIIFSAFIFASCENKPCDCDDLAETPISAPANIIPLAAADSLYTDYGNNNVTLLELAENVTEEGDTIPSGDAKYKRATRAVALPYKQLKEYLKYIEQQADSAGVDIVDLRIYFGKYGKKAPHKDKKGKETVFLNPTAEFTLADGTKDTVSYAIVKAANGKYSAVMVGTLLNPKKEEMSSEATEEVLSMSANKGQTIPPPYNNPNDFD